MGVENANGNSRSTYFTMFDWKFIETMLNLIERISSETNQQSKLFSLLYAEGFVLKDMWLQNFHSFVLIDQQVTTHKARKRSERIFEKEELPMIERWATILKQSFFLSHLDHGKAFEQHEQSSLVLLQLTMPFSLPLTYFYV